MTSTAPLPPELQQLKQDLRADMAQLRADVAEVKHELTRYKGFIGGVVWALSALGAALSLAFSGIGRH